MIIQEHLYEALESTPLQSWKQILPSQLQTAFCPSRHGKNEAWAQVLSQLPRLDASSVDLNADCIRIGQFDDCDVKTRYQLKNLLLELHPWRKGPYLLHGVHIDSEWRSEMKWNRLSAHIAPLDDRLILDVGCGNGYHCWRMAGEGAKLVIGVDPTLLSVVQFQAIKHFTREDRVFVLPLSIEDIPPEINGFDTVFSMGLLYHRRSPIDHLLELRGFLQNGGELVLETLIIDGKSGQTLIPEGRYAKMRNVWFIPSCPTLSTWLKRCGFVNIRLIDVARTTQMEQRSTDWMRFQSLPNFLHPNDKYLTCESLPAPKRAIFIANKP